MEENYHKQALLIHGKKEFFIPKEEIEYIFEMSNFFSLNKASAGDNISFFDKEGNIIYQALVEKVENKTVYIRCDDLETGEEYVTILGFENIRGFSKSEFDTVMVYKGD